MRADRLLKLADHLENSVKEGEFDMSRWSCGCGTVGCAMGHACNIPEFIQDGLRLDYEYGLDDFKQLVPMYDGYIGFAAAAQFFEIPMCTADDLFSETEYDGEEPVTPRDVATRIRELVANAPN